MDWLAKRLKEDDADNAFLLYHNGFTKYGIPSYPVGPNGYQLSAITTNVLKLCEAYNNGTSITLNGKTYNFAGCTGCVRFILSGHIHEDAVETHYGIPVVSTAYMRELESTPTFDLCLADYDNAVLHMVRVGSGTDREVALAKRGT